MVNKEDLPVGVIALNDELNFTDINDSDNEKLSTVQSAIELYNNLTATLSSKTINADSNTITNIFTFKVAASDANAKVIELADYVCDGTADDVQIQAAIDALPATGGKIVLSEGTFQVAAEIVLDSNVTIEGQGDGTVVQLSSMADNLNAFTTNVTQSDSTAYNINDVTEKDTTVTLDTGTEESNFTVGDYVALNTTLNIDPSNPSNAFQGDYYKVSSVTGDTSGVIGLEEYALEDYANTPTLTVVDFIQNITLKNFRITDSTADGGRTSQANGHAVFALFVDGLSIENLTVDGVFTSGINTRACLNVRITDCRFKDIKVISGGQIHYGVIFTTGRNFLVDNCNFYNTRHAVTNSATGTVRAHYGYTRNLLVSNCTSSISTQAHFDTHQGAKGVAFTNLTMSGFRSLSGSSPNGIQCRSPTLISNCEISSIDNIGIRVTDDGDNTTTGGSGTVINSCYIHDVDEGILIDEFMQDVVISNNRIENCTSECIQTVATATVKGVFNLVVIGNLLYSAPTVEAIRLDSSENVLISDNRIISGTHWLRCNSTEGTQCSGVAQNNFVTGGGTEAGTVTSMRFFGNRGITSNQTDIENDGAGADPSLSSNSANQELTVTGDLNVTGDIVNVGTMKLTEQVSANADEAGKGQLWVKNTTPNELWFTDDAGTDVQLGVGGGGGDTNAVKWKDPVRVATTVNGTLATAFANGQTVDTITLATNDRILLKNQSTASENGIYNVNSSGAPTRAADFNGNDEVSAAVTVSLEGSANGGKAWLMTNTGAITLGTTALTFTEFGAGGGGGDTDTEFPIPLVQVVPEGTVGFPSIHALATATAHVSGMVLPNSAASTINFKTMHPIPNDLASTPAARIEFVIMTRGAVAGPEDVRLTVSSLAVGDGESFDQVFASESETTVTMPTTTETQDVYSQDMTTDPVAGDTVLVQLARDPDDLADGFTDDIQIISATLWIQRST